jgi:hypothetical protein
VGTLIRVQVYDNVEYWKTLQMMANRMAFSEQKYGSLESNYPHPKVAYNNIEVRLRMYRETGNTENLLDAANFAVIEHLHPAHPKAHFLATDSDGSPGLV